MMALMSASRVEAPHSTFADFGSKVDKVEKAAGEAEGVTIWKGTLSDAGTEALQAATRAGRGRGRGGFGGGRGGQGGEGGDGPVMDTVGSFTITAKNGKITAVSFELITEGFIRDREFESTRTTSFTFGKLGEAKVVVPDEALAHFEI